MNLNEWVNNYIKEVTHSHEYEDMSQMGEDENDPQEINVGNYQTKYFHVCPGASKLYGDIESKGVDMDMAERSVRLQDALYFIEEHIQRDGYKPERDYVMVAKNIAKNIMKMANMMGLEKEHDYIQGHIDTIEKVVKGKGLEEGDGLWANIRAKRARGEKPAHGNSQAHKDAVKAAKKINKESVSEGVMSELDILAKEAKDLKSFIKVVFKEFDNLPKNRETLNWLEDTYKNSIDESINETADYKYLTQVILDAKPKYDVYYNSSHNVVNIGGVGYDKGDLVKNFNQKPGSSSKIKNNFYHAHQDPQKTKREVEKLSKGKIKVKVGDRGFLSYSVNESVNEGNESDSDMAVDQLEASIKKAQELIAKLRGKGDLEPWVQSLITKAEDYISTVSDYGETKNEATAEEEDEFHTQLDKLVHKTFGHSSDEEKMNEASEPEIITQLRSIVSNKQNQKLKDPKSGKQMRVDLYSASAVTQVYDALKQQSNKDKFVGMGLVGMVNTAFKLINKHEIVEYDVETLEELNDFHQFMKEYKSDINEAEYQGRKVELGKIMQGDVKKFKVYVKNDKGNVVKVNFGQKGMTIKKDNPGARKSFRARMNCDSPGPRWKARYWSCRKW